MPEAGLWTLSFCTVAYALFLLNTAHLQHSDLRQLHRVAFEKEALPETLNKAEARAEEATVAKSDFLAPVSHKIRMPMSGLIGMLQLVRDSALTANAIDEDWARIARLPAWMISSPSP